jgi:hypothetical protein
MPPSDPVSPTSVVVGLLEAVERDAIVLRGNQRFMFSPGVKAPFVAIGTSLTVVAVKRDGVWYAEKIQRTPGGFFNST